jgi:hypothetical protein
MARSAMGEVLDEAESNSIHEIIYSNIPNIQNEYIYIYIYIYIYSFNIYEGYTMRQL